MATKTFEELKQLAIQIRDEKTNKANTATRIGTQMIEHLNKLEQEYYNIQTVDGLVSEYNVSVNHPTSGIDGSNKYTLSSAIALVPEQYRSIGIKCSFVNEEEENETWEWGGSSWYVDSFTKIGSYKFTELESNTLYIIKDYIQVDSILSKGYNVNIKKGEKIRLLFKSNFQLESTITVSISQNGNNIQYITDISLNKEIVLTANNDCNRLNIFSETISNVNVNFEAVKHNSLLNRINVLEYDVLSMQKQSLYETFERLSVTTDNYVSIGYPIEVKQGEILIFSIEDTEGCLAENGITINLNYSGENIQYINNVSPNQKIVIKAKNNANTLQFYAPQENILSDGEILIKLLKKSSPINSAEEAKTEIGNIINYDVNVYKGYVTSDVIYTDIKKGDKLRLLISSEKNNIIKENGINCNITDGLDIQYITNISVGVLEDITANKDCNNFNIYISDTNVFEDGIINISLIKVGSILDRIQLTEKEIQGNTTSIGFLNDNLNGVMSILGRQSDLISGKYKNKKVGILGDSYSTFRNHIVTGNAAWYPMNIDRNNVQDVEQTWWKKVCNSIFATEIINDSYSGSAICNINDEFKTFSFITRMKRTFNNGNDFGVIFVFGATNDYWNNAELGEAKYSDWTDEDLTKLYPAICYMFDYLKNNNPNTIIINLLNGIISKDITDEMTDIANYYSIPSIYLPDSEVSKMDGHPDISGMESIYSRVMLHIMNDL